jgi:hypothetical protein
MKVLIFFICVFYSNNLIAQYGYNARWIVGDNGAYAYFADTINRPITGGMFNSTSPNYPNNVSNGTSNICDSSTGEILLISDGMRVFDKFNNLIDNGDYLVPNNIYYHNAFPESPVTQTSLIAPLQIVLIQSQLMEVINFLTIYCNTI